MCVASLAASTILLNTPSDRLNNDAGLPNSTTRPPSNTKSKSQSNTVSILCAMISKVFSWVAIRACRVSWIKASVLRSTLAVASSSARILESVRSALYQTTRKWSKRRRSNLARHSNCRCPTLKLSPHSATGALIPPKAVHASDKCTLSSTDHIWASLYSHHGSKFERSVPANKNGSCGMTDSCFLNTSIPIVEVSTPSIKIRPTSISINLKHTWCSKQTRNEPEKT